MKDWKEYNTYQAGLAAVLCGEVEMPRAAKEYVQRRRKELHAEVERETEARCGKYQAPVLDDGGSLRRQRYLLTLERLSAQADNRAWNEARRREWEWE